MNVAEVYRLRPYPNIDAAKGVSPVAKPTVRFLLPGLTRQPVGGYKVAYEYANYLATHYADLVLVEVHHAKWFQFAQLHHQQSRVRILADYAKQAVLRIGGVRWYPLNRAVKSRVWIGRPKMHSNPEDIWIATSCQTAPFASEQSTAGNGVYFIQHFETWAAPQGFVEETWRLDLDKVVIAPWLLDKAHELGVTATYIPNAIDPGHFQLGEPQQQRSRSVLAMISSIPFKRLDLIIEAFDALHRADPNIVLRTFGTIPRPPELPAYVQHTKNPSPSELTGLYQQSRVYLTASDAEGWHLPPAEALLCGCALVSTDIGGVRAYADGVALFSPPGDAGSLAINARYLCDRPIEAQERVDVGRAALLSYTPALAADRFAQFCVGRLRDPA